MIGYQTNESGIFIGQVDLDESPREPGVYHYPRGCVDVAPPTILPGYRARWTNGAWVIEDAATAVPLPPGVAQDARRGMTLSFRQLLIGLVAEGWITEAEGEAWLVGTLPSPVLALIATLPAPAQFPAKASAIRPSVILRLDPLVASLAAAEGKTDAELDTFFLTYANV